MATGIVSVGLLMQGLRTLSTALLWLAAACYLVLVALNVRRAAVFRHDMRQDLTRSSRGVGFFTFVAGTNVLGTRLAFDGHTTTAAVLLVVGGLAWLVLGYLLPVTVMLHHRGWSAATRADGTWFTWVVAAQSVAVLAAALQGGTGTARQELALLAVFAWSVGVFCYAVVGILVATRLMLDRPSPADLSPPYWVGMGATAITVLAGARILSMADTAVITATRELVTGVSVLFWAFGTWLIPALLAAGWWRHVTHRVPLRYESLWWNIVFPLGMYGVATRTLGDTVHLPLLTMIGTHELWIALTAWAATFTAMLWSLTRAVRRNSASGPGNTR
ncbi:tellurite resistance protein TehA-like permease [Halopolyspora algeriensis]|uniref:Tellurite resistance protein TehA-like permease n=2 Tax=Halopolyspora algeriensis TaxID=1500506 RepID=A0A368VX97_9ACTN|nr:tellurite resistance protein TehA-like permease [Halopolyspora algeriensis]TQM55393.1 tellurite resistance protein TehA-like permease [Halopolyspora algeriensis]